MNSVHSNNEVVKRERQEEAAIAPPSSSSSSKQGDSTSAPKITMRDRDEVLEKLWSKYFERISRGEGGQERKQEEDVIASPSSKHGNNDDITSAPTIMTMRERDEVLEKLWSKYFERISRGERKLVAMSLVPPESFTQSVAFVSEHVLELVAFPGAHVCAV
ncbi:hypothetical protein Scep_022382 [Stephania cephalantha]|uniref:Uncharacterized protein n=1 Tax=Stephania cephalantha TaxID=152367 RepID=A0AAP0HXQ3_9MAGN